MKIKKQQRSKLKNQNGNCLKMQKNDINKCQSKLFIDIKINNVEM